MALGGCIVDSGNFDWEAHKEKFPGLPHRMNRIMVLFTPRNSAKKHTSQKQPHS